MQLSSFVGHVKWPLYHAIVSLPAAEKPFIPIGIMSKRKTITRVHITSEDNGDSPTSDTLTQIAHPRTQ